jgi:hypothetical protein
MTETDLKRDILGYLRRRGIWATRVQSGMVHYRGHVMRLAEEGTPDILGCLPDGRHLAVEVKLPRWKPRNEADRRRFELQQAYCDHVTRAGGVGLVARSVEDVEERLG